LTGWTIKDSLKRSGGVNQGVGEGVGVVVYGIRAVGKYTSGVEFGIRRCGGDKYGIYVDWWGDFTDSSQVDKFTAVDGDGVGDGCRGGDAIDDRSLG
jgi:hypothetical protein